MKQIRVKMTKDHKVQIDVNTTRTYPKGLVFGLPEDTAQEFVRSGAAGYVDQADAEAGPRPEDADDGLEKLKKDELEALAKDRGIDLGDAKTKAEIIDVLRKAPVS